MRQFLTQYPNARVLALAPFQERVESIAKWYGSSASVLERERPQAAKIICATPKQARKDLRFLGYIDLIVVDDCANMSPIVGSKRYTEIYDDLIKRNKSLKLIVYQTQAVLRLPEIVKPSWRCGVDGLNVKVPMTDVVISHGNKVPCGASNDLEHYFCRACGRFRGFADDLRGTH